MVKVAEFSVRSLSPRYREVVVLVGGERLSYKAAAKRLANLHRQDEANISHHTVRQYSREIRDLVGCDLSPRDCLTELYWSNRAELGR